MKKLTRIVSMVLVIVRKEISMKGAYKRTLAQVLAGVLVFALMAPGMMTLAAGINPADTSDITAATSTIQSANYSGTNVEIPDASMAKTRVETALSLMSASLNGVSYSNVVINNFVPATSANGSFGFTVNLSKLTPGSGEFDEAATGQASVSNITITYDPTADNADIITAKSAVESGSTYSTTQAEAGTDAAAKAEAERLVAAKITNGVTREVTNGTFNEAIAGTEGAPAGTNGSYTFNVYLTKGGGTPQTTTTLTMVITATPYADPDQTAVEAVTSAQIWNAIKGENTNQNQVSKNLINLTTIGSGEYAVNLSWMSSNTGIIANTGVVTPTATNTNVTLDVTLSKGSSAKQTTINVIVLAAANDNQAQVNAIANWLTWDRIRNSNPSGTTSGRYELRSSMTRPTAPSSAGGITITARNTISFNFSLTNKSPSNSYLAVTTAGAVTRADRYTTATLVVTVVKGSGTARVEAQKTFSVFGDVSGDMEILEDVAYWLNWNWIKGSNTDTSSPYDVYADLDLDRSFNSNNTIRDRSSSSTTYYTTSVLKDVRIRWFWDPDNSGSAYDVDIDLYTGEVDEFPERDSRGDLIAHVYFYGDESYFADVYFDVNFKAGDDAAQIKAVQNWLTWNIIRGSNGSQSSIASNNTTSRRLEVTSNLNLNPTIPTSLDRSSTDSTDITISGINITWSASPSRVSGTGIVTFPASGSTQVTLTATIRKGTSSANQETKTFYLSILPAEDQAVVNEAITWLTWNQIRKSNGANSSSTGPYITFSDLTLPTSYETDDGEVVTIRWNTSNSNYVRTNGEVTSPTNSSSQNVTLTAVFTYESINSTSTTNNPNTKTFELTVRRPTDREAVTADRDAITWDFIKRQNTSQTRVTTDLNLPDFGDNGSTIVWSSSNTAVISNTGRVTRPAAGVSNATVTLTASLRKGNITNTKTITVTVLSVDGETAFEVVNTANGTTATLSREGFAAISKNGTNSVEAKMGICDISFDANAASTIYSQTNGNIVIAARIVPSSEIPAAIRTLLGDRPVIDLTILGGDRTITNFNGTAIVRIPYTLRLGEKANSLVMYYLDSSGSYHLIRGFYDAVNRQLVFKTKHFSRFQIGYNPKTFTDIQDSWAIDAIEFIGARELTVGITGTSFEPLKALSRGEFTANLMKAYGIEIDRTATDNFTDVNPQEAYAPYLATGKKMGIITGTGGNNFAPTRQIGRAEMFALLYNILKAIGEVPPAVEGGKTLASFTDSNEVGEWFREGVDALLRANMIDGTGNNLLQPRAPTARATMAQMLYNLLTR